MIQEKKPFAFARYADGERAILENRPILEGTQAFNVDKWRFFNNHIFSSDLFETCNHREENFFHAISCSCCDKKTEQFYRGLFANHNITFSNLFINANYQPFINFVKTIEDEVVLIANEKCNSASYPFKIKKTFEIKNDCVNWYESNREQIKTDIRKLAKENDRTLFLIAAGPLSEILIHNMFEENGNNMYVDVGSSLDIFTHGIETRPYQRTDSMYFNKECFFE